MKLNQYEILSVGGSGTVSGNIKEACTSENFTVDILNSIQKDMSLDQTNKTIGCTFDTGATQRMPALGFVTYVWKSTQAPYAYIRIWFDSTGSYTHPYQGSLLTQTGGF